MNVHKSQLIFWAAAGTAAAQAIRANRAVQDVDYGKLAKRLKQEGCRF